MYNGSPKPLNKPAQQGLFEVDDSVTVTKSVETPMQRQRRLDGTPHTVTGYMCNKPQGPELVLKSLSPQPEQSGITDTSPKMLTPLNPDDVLKAYMTKED